MVMELAYFLKDYLLWHYLQAPVAILRIWRDVFWFLMHYFSLPLLLKTLFSPFYRIGEEYGRGIDLEKIAATFVVNTISRAVGFLLRMCVILVGVLALLVAALLLPAALVLWVFLPVSIIPLLLTSGLKPIF